MNERSPSYRLRICALLLAALMLFGNLYLPNGVFAVSAAESGWNTLPMEEDFEDKTVDTSGSFAVTGSASAVASVCEDDKGNKMLAVSNVGGTEHGYASLAFRKGAGSYYTGTVHLSYWLSASGTGRFYIPTVSSYLGTTNSLAVFVAMKPDGTMEYATSTGGPWNPLTYTDGSGTVTYSSNEWILIEQTYTCAATAGNQTMTMKINGKEVTIASAHRDKVSHVSMYMTNDMGSQICYVDNITVTEAPHEPMPNPGIDPLVPATGVSFVDANGQPIQALTVKTNSSTTLDLSFTPADAYLPSTVRKLPFGSSIKVIAP